MGLRVWASLLAGAFVAAFTLVATPALAAPIKVACTGSSSMAGTGSSAGHHIPDELAKALGPDFTVENFAVAATTAIKSVPNAWASTTQMSDALSFNPDVVLFWFGGNDSWADVWTAHSGEFKADYTSLVQAFQALPSHPKTVLIRLWVFKDGPAQLSVLDQEILPIIDMIAAETNSGVIDYRSFMEPHPEWFPDGMHANDTGTAAIGPFFAEQLNAFLKASPPSGAGGSGGASGSGSSGSANVAGGGVAQGGASNPAGTGGLADAGGGVGTAGTSGSAFVPGASGSSSSSATVSSNESGCNQGGTPRNGSALWLLSALALLVVLKSRLA